MNENEKEYNGYPEYPQDTSGNNNDYVNMPQGSQNSQDYGYWNQNNYQTDNQQCNQNYVDGGYSNFNDGNVDYDNNVVYNNENYNQNGYQEEQLYWYQAEDGNYYDQYGRPWVGNQANNQFNNQGNAQNSVYEENNYADVSNTYSSDNEYNAEPAEFTNNISHSNTSQSNTMDNGETYQREQQDSQAYQYGAENNTYQNDYSYNYDENYGQPIYDSSGYNQTHEYTKDTEIPEQTYYYSNETSDSQNTQYRQSYSTDTDTSKADTNVQDNVINNNTNTYYQNNDVDTVTSGYNMNDSTNREYQMSSGNGYPNYTGSEYGTPDEINNQNTNADEDTSYTEQNTSEPQSTPTFQDYKQKQDELNQNKNDYAKKEASWKKILPKVGVVVLVGVLAGGGFSVYNRYFKDKSEVRVCESTTSYNKGIGFTFYIGKDGQTITAIEKNDKVSLDFIKKNVTEENAKQILEEYKKNVKSVYKENVEKYKKLSFFSSKIDVKENSISTTYRFDVGSKKFKYKQNEAMMNDFGLNYYYNEDLGKFVYNEDQFLSASTPLGGIDNVQCNKVDIKVVQDKK